MICHVCRQGATGQCKNCGKFYCPEHGDVYCVSCRPAADRLTGAPRQAAATSGQVGQPQPTVASVVPACYACQEPAVGKCDKCGKPFCNRHGEARPRMDFTRTLICSSCMANRVIIVTVFLVLGMLIALAVTAFLK
jgi:hypothetical protein